MREGCASRRKSHRITAIAGLTLLVCLLPVLLGQSGGQKQDAEFAKLVRQWTTRPEFLSPLVDHLPLEQGMPTAKELLGHYVGAPKQLTYYNDIVGYYRKLAARTARVRVMTIGKTDEGRDCVVVLIGSDESMRSLEQYRHYLAQLADPRSLTDEQARALIEKARPIYLVMGGLHSSETGPPEMLMELAYRLAVEDSPLINLIRANVIVAIDPVAEPDGRDRYVDWYYRYLVDLTDEQDRMPGPPYWGKYVLHDNNRDINYSQLTMRALLDWYLQWHPPILHDIHESIPFLYTFSGQAPQNPVLDPILFAEMPWFANFEMAQMISYGMPGVWTHGFMDMWGAGYLGSMAPNHNGMLRMYEVFGNGGATTMKRKTESGERRGGSQITREWYRPLPAYKEVEWSIRNNINYAETGVLSALQLTAAFPKVVLDNFYRKSRNSIETGKTEAPFGYVIPGGQRDMARVALIVNLLRMQGIEVGRANAEVKLKEGTFPAGSYIIKCNQPYGRLAKILLEKQSYPDPNLRTYDDTGWTMGLMIGADVKESADKAVLDLSVSPVTEVKPSGTISGAEAAFGFAVAHNGSNNLITLRCRLKELKIQAVEKHFKSGSDEFPSGSLLIAGNQGGRGVNAQIRAAVAELGLTATAIASRPEVEAHEVDLPRLAVYSTWGSTQDVGWVRYAFDKFEIPYDLIYKDRVRKGGLRSSFDVIIIPNQSGSGKRLVYDLEPRDRPISYTRTDRFKNLGMYGEAEDITGGMGVEGVLEFQKFLADGGLLITLGNASYFPVDFGLARNVDASRPSGQFYAPGPIVEAEIQQTESPVFYGYTRKTVPVRYANGPLLQIPERYRSHEGLMQFPGGEKSVLSGLMKNPNDIRNRPAIVQVPAGKGTILLYATNPCYRWQNHAEFNMLFNAILNYRELIPSQP